MLQRRGFRGEVGSGPQGCLCLEDVLWKCGGDSGQLPHRTGAAPPSSGGVPQTERRAQWAFMRSSIACGWRLWV